MKVFSCPRILVSIKIQLPVVRVSPPCHWSLIYNPPAWVDFSSGTCSFYVLILPIFFFACHLQGSQVPLANKDITSGTHLGSCYISPMLFQLLHAQRTVRHLFTRATTDPVWTEKWLWFKSLEEPVPHEAWLRIGYNYSSRWIPATNKEPHLPESDTAQVTRFLKRSP